MRLRQVELVDVPDAVGLAGSLVADSRAAPGMEVGPPREDEDASAGLLSNDRSRGGLLREPAVVAGAAASGPEVESRLVVTGTLAVGLVNLVNLVNPRGPAGAVLVVVVMRALRRCWRPPPAPPRRPADVVDEHKDGRDGGAADSRVGEADGDDETEDQQNEGDEDEHSADDDQLGPSEGRR